MKKKDNLQDFLLYIIKEFIIMLKLMKNKPIVIVSGDPKSTFNEILIKTLKNRVLKNLKFPLIIIGSKKLLENESKKLKTKLNLQKFENQIRLRKKNIYIVASNFFFERLWRVFSRNGIV